MLVNSYAHHCLSKGALLEEGREGSEENEKEDENESARKTNKLKTRNLEEYVIGRLIRRRFWSCSICWNGLSVQQ